VVNVNNIYMNNPPSGKVKPRPTKNLLHIYLRALSVSALPIGKPRPRR
jgi:hypothetical protein